MTPPSSLRGNNFGMSTASWPNMAQPPPTRRSVRASTRRRATNGSRCSFPAPTLRPPPWRQEEADLDAPAPCNYRKMLACQFGLIYWRSGRSPHVRYCAAAKLPLSTPPGLLSPPPLPPPRPPAPRLHSPPPPP